MGWGDISVCYVRTHKRENLLHPQHLHKNWADSLHLTPSTVGYRLGPPLVHTAQAQLPRHGAGPSHINQDILREWP